MSNSTAKIRCVWANTNEMFISYHDEEWGVPVHDDRMLFEMLSLEGAQAGLSWLIVLRKRDSYRLPFDNFQAHKIINYDENKRAKLLANPGIVRNRLKINAVIENAEAFLRVQKEFGSFDNYIWHFVANKPQSGLQHDKAVTISEHMSMELKKRGFRFVGPTICFAFMQAVGLLNDHQGYCFRASEI
jgi:DNA-3-methyladenine glycosylase I